MKQTNAEEEDADDLAHESTGDATAANAEGKEGGDDRSEEDGSEKNSGARREEERMVALAATMMVTLANICNGYGMPHTAGVEPDGGLDVEYSTGSHQHGELRRRGGQESDKTGVKPTTVFCDCVVNADIHVLVALTFFGSSGNGATPKKLADFFSIGTGTVSLYVRRAVEALFGLHDDVIAWLNPNKRRALASRIRAKWRCPNCVGFIDGTLLPLEFKPALCGED
ncbi:hypothetical protein PR002_g22638 [Phytophthora rubi]|uniref:DDE Tnp4 domain-containing protein n=1 Tax=Phytophthora rubi TaxID=129364 RepID=A0A6A3IUD2_9STRA|nr:hypothetical protein PR002_g22638 [Phytophthora rubi]